MKVVVTGGRGFLGTHVCAALGEAGHEPVELGRADGDLPVAGAPDTGCLRSLGRRAETALEDGIRATLDRRRGAA